MAFSNVSMACWLRRSTTGAGFLAVMGGPLLSKAAGGEARRKPRGGGGGRAAGLKKDPFKKGPVEPTEGRADLDPRRASPQPAGGGLRHPPEPPGGDYGAVGVRKEQPGLRPPLRRV